MKRVFLIILTCLLTLVACEEITPIEEKADYISVDQTEVHFTMQGGEQLLRIKLKSDSRSWTLTGATDWCVPARTSGTASTSLKISVALNGGASRSTTLTFTSPDCDPVSVVVTQDGIAQKAMPQGVKPGVNYNSDGSVTFVFYDKDKNGLSHDYAYLIGEFNDWKTSPQYAMNRDGASGCWWYTLTDMAPRKEYMFQYYLGYFSEDEGRAYADPYSEVVYEIYDRYISSTTYPGLKTYPSGTKGAISSFQIEQDEYVWEVEDYQIKDGNDLVIYELHFRDFTATGDINGALEKMDYLENLGVTAIELMPIQEFDGSDSWGYNPIAYFALEKSYGTREMYKKFIDECHKRDIAVLVDVVYNHVHENHAMAGLYFDWKKYVPTENNPWFNVTAPHPHSVFHDWNHEEPMVKDHIKQSLTYLIEEYKIDGFRFDLTKGFTNFYSGDNDGVASRYDASRVAILKDYAAHIKSVDPNAVVILEHFVDAENYDLGKEGIKVWRNVNYEGISAVHGSAGNFGNLWTGSDVAFGTYVGYFESHDEERLCYGAMKGGAETWGLVGTINDWGKTPDIAMEADGKFFVAKEVEFTKEDMFKIRGNGEWNDAYNYGGSVKGAAIPFETPFTLTLGSGSQDMAAPAAGTYDVYFCPAVSQIWMMPVGKRPAEPEYEEIDPLELAMRRAGASAAFLLTVPGPKMIWQFGEMGYDESIEEGGRTGRKPLHWEYYDVPERKALYDTYAGLLRFRRENPRFFDMDARFEWNPYAAVKTIKGSVDGKTFYVVGNFGTSRVDHALPAGTWKDYFNDGASVSGNVSLGQGQFKLLTSF